jgi:hypothetical protein
MSRAETAGENVAGESVRAQGREILVERDDHGLVETDCRQEFELQRQRGEMKKGPPRLEEFARVRIEDDRARTLSFRVRETARFA